MHGCRRLALVAAFFALAIAPARADVISGNVLLDRCTSPDGTPQMTFCLGYVLGVTDQAIHDGKVCMSTSVGAITADRVRDLTLEKLRLLPERRHYSGASFVEAALASAFPCR